ncbi:unnamed protein product [Cyclocybe aegerita]|uniref:DUF6534 domain-containing protein n=1 Tax=Cyclocybe aegerita TaxID=1973307 RepID=A0A8S0XFH1_CYCAE|nr:unnamed protein product [Cyclocybe aegerita]
MEINSPQVIPVDLEKAIGPQFLSGLLSAVLFGILSSQVYIFYQAVPGNPAYTKALVYGIYILETVQTGLIFQTAFRKYVTSFGDFQSLDQVGTLWLTVPMLTAVGTVIAQTFYAYRVYLLSKSKAVCAVIMLLASIQLTAGMVFAVFVKDAPFLSPVAYPTKVHVSLALWHGGSALCDLVIASAMVYYLSTFEFRTTNESISLTIKKLIRSTLETGILTAVVALILSLLPNNAANYQAVSLIFGKIYGNSMLVLINRRVHFRTEDERRRVTFTASVGSSVFWPNETRPTHGRLEMGGAASKNTSMIAL